MPLERLARELDYDDWANREVLESLRRAEASQGGCPPRCLEWLGHIVGTKSEWLARLEGRKSELAVWPTLSLAEIGSRLEGSRGDWSRFLEGLGPDLGRLVSYRNTRGELWSSRVEDVIAQVLFHGAYHRGQIASALRSSGHTPPTTDYIHAVRQGLLDSTRRG